MARLSGLSSFRLKLLPVSRLARLLVGLLPLGAFCRLAGLDLHLPPGEIRLTSLRPLGHEALGP